ncbi:Hypothetical predicted protein [Olea europaea subsp. europaea]|uniref:Uncharacterized protein n=1 Tax=Olea europaea subsp. europaea TaxID=158383 RepID=A0A8S0SF15_OLEEU|nr:Hypothetical predicted protein [Olea europaea subsp. europaea]
MCLPTIFDRLLICLVENPHLIYAIIRSHRRFESLASFTLRCAVDVIRRVRSERKSTSIESSDSPSRPEFKSTPSSTSLASIGTLLGEEKFDGGTEEEDPVRMSEKARGKMRERSGSMDSIAGDSGPPGPYRSKSGFVPTEACECLHTKEHLPLDSVLIMLAELRPKVSSLCSVASASTNQAAMDFLKSVTLLDVLPHRETAFGPRRFVHSAMSLRWLLSLVWSLTYVSIPYLGGTRVALFNVQQSAQTDLLTAVRDGGTLLTRRLTSGNSSPGQRGGSAVV